MKPRVLRINGRWVLADWYCRLPGTDAIVYRPLRSADTVRGLSAPEEKKSWRQRLSDWVLP